MCKATAGRPPADDSYRVNAINRSGLPGAEPTDDAMA